MLFNKSVAAHDVLTSDFSSHIGISYGPWELGKSVVRLEMKPHHLNRLGIAHGGIILTLLDVVCGMAGMYQPPGSPRRPCVTVSLTTNFIAATKTTTIHGSGKLTSERKSLFYASGELSDDDGMLLATATGVYKYLPSPPPDLK